MLICRPSRIKRAAVALTALSLIGIAAAHAQTAPRSAAGAAQDAGDDAMTRLRAAVESRKQASQVKPPTHLPTPSQEERRRAADAIKSRVRSPAMEARARAALDKSEEALGQQREAMAQRVAQALGLEQPDMKALGGALGPTQKAWVPLLFVSSSMPVPILRTYAAQLERAGGVLAFRGMPGGLSKVGPMARLSAEILRLDPGCEGPACAMRNVQVIVDPLVFRQHGVARVPALAMVPGDPTQPYCERDDDSPRAEHVVYGDAALSGLLEEYARLGGKEEVRDAQARLESR